MSFTRWLSDSLSLSSRTSGRASRPASKRKATAPRRTFRPSMECLEDRWVPSTLQVTSSADIATQHGTLRWAVATAQNGDTIRLTHAVQSTGITLTQGELVLTQQGLTIKAAGDTPVMISGGGISRVFEVATGADVTLSNLAITGGNGLANNPAGDASNDRSGGGIQVDAGAALTVRGSTLYGNSAFYNGGGISIYIGTLTVIDSTLSGNSASYGGGISNNTGTLTVRGCTLSGNSANFGGGIYNDAFATLTTVRDSTLSGNSASAGGGIYSDAMLTVRDSTLSGNSATIGGGIYNGGTMTARGSTLSDNSATYGGGIYNSYGTVTVSRSTLSGNSATIAGGGIFNSSSGTLTVSHSSTICGNSAPVGFGADLYNLGYLFQDTSSMICILDGNPAIPI